VVFAFTLVSTIFAVTVAVGEYGSRSCQQSEKTCGRGEFGIDELH
jgi:hypothetical protein